MLIETFVRATELAIRRREAMRLALLSRTIVTGARATSVACLLSINAWACGSSNSRSSTPAPPPVTEPAIADAAFQAARFDDARALYARIHEVNPGDAHAVERLGALALLDNRLDEAEKFLLMARTLDPASTTAAGLLTEIYVRRDLFASAAPMARAAGRELRAKQLESFGVAAPYAIDGPDEDVVPFVVRDPLPLVEARAPDGSTLTLLIDTGGGEILLDAKVAERLSVRRIGDTQGTFAGGKQAPVGQGQLSALTLGSVTVHRMPVGIQNLAPLAEDFEGRHIDGVLGTVLLYHFESTIDYPGQRLVLRRRGVARHDCRGASISIKLAGSHFVLAGGALGPRKDMVWLVDTGLAGGGFSASEETLRSAGIALDRAHASRGVGGGGETEAIPFVVPELSLGSVVERDVPGLYGGAFPVPRLLGFRVDGLVSHDFLKPYAVTFDFDRMTLCLAR
jgi:hypothetical protein